MLEINSSSKRCRSWDVIKLVGNVSTRLVRSEMLVEAGIGSAIRSRLLLSTAAPDSIIGLCL